MVEQNGGGWGLTTFCENSFPVCELCTTGWEKEAWNLHLGGSTPGLWVLWTSGQGLMVLESWRQRSRARSTQELQALSLLSWRSQGTLLSLALLPGILGAHCCGEHGSVFLSSFAQENNSMLWFIHSNSYILIKLCWACYILCPFSPCSWDICLWSEETLLVIIVSFSQSGSLCPIIDCCILLRRPHRTAGRLNAAQHWKHQILYRMISV